MISENTNLKTFDIKERKLQLITVILLIILLPLLLYLLQQALQIGIQGAPDAELSLIPRDITQTQDKRWVLPINEDVVIDIVLDGGSNKVEAVEATIFYDPTVLTLKRDIGFATDNIECSPFTALQYGWVKNIGGLSVNSSGVETGIETGYATIVCSAIPPVDQWINNTPAYEPTPVGLTAPVATLRFKTLKQATNSSLSFKFTHETSENNSSVLSYEGSCCSTTEALMAINNLTFDVGQHAVITPTKPQAEPTSSEPAKNNPINNIEIFLQGRDWKGAPRSRDIVINIEDVTIPVNPFTVTLDNQGIIGIGQDVLSQITGDGSYAVYIKPAGFLQRKAILTVKNGTYSIDLTSVPFLAGDLDGSGKINELDYNILLQQYKSYSTLADLDGSGQVNGLDTSYMFSNWGKSDEGNRQ